jgi:hypothetical protein
MWECTEGAPVRKGEQREIFERKRKGHHNVPACEISHGGDRDAQDEHPNAVCLCDVTSSKADSSRETGRERSFFYLLQLKAPMIVRSRPLS